MLLDSSWQAPRDTCDATPCRVEYELHAVRYEVDAADVADIPFEHCDPVRAFPAWPGKRHYSGLLWLESLGKHVGFESFTERTCLMELDRDPEVTAVSSQPMWIRWGDGSPRGHVPDYFAWLRDGRAAVIDVRPLQLIDDDARRQFDRTAVFCRDRDWQYAVFAPDTQVRDANLRFLLRYRAAQWRVTDVPEKARGFRGSIRELAGRLSNGDEADRLALCFALIWSGVLIADLDTPLSLRTHVRWREVG